VSAPPNAKAFNFEEHSTAGILLNLNADWGKESATSMKGWFLEKVSLKLGRYHGNLVCDIKPSIFFQRILRMKILKAV